MRFSFRSWMARFALRLVLSACALAAAQVMPAEAFAQAMPAGAKPPEAFPHVKLTAGMFVIDAAVAANDADREQGLMYRTQLAPNATLEGEVVFRITSL